MLTAREQEEILAEVRRVFNVEKMMAARLRHGTMSPQAVAQAKQKAWDNLRDVLKEIG